MKTSRSILLRKNGILVGERNMKEAILVLIGVSLLSTAAVPSGHVKEDLAILQIAVADTATTHMGDPVKANVLDNDNLPQGVDFTAHVMVEPNHGVLFFDSDTGEYIYQPDVGFVGTDTFIYVVTDGELIADTATVTITVTNTPPTPGDDAATTDQDVAVIIDVLANDSDPDGDPLAVYSFTYEGAGTVVLNEDGTFTYTPAVGFVGEDCFTYSVSDGEIGTEPILATVIITVKSKILTVFVDIKPTSCPNPLNVKSKGVLPVAILGTEDFDVLDIAPATLKLEGVAPLHFSYEDVATPFDGELCDCHEAGPDGYLDLTLKFDTQEIVGALGRVVDGDELELILTGEDVDGIPIEGSDCIRVIKKGKD